MAKNKWFRFFEDEAMHKFNEKKSKSDQILDDDAKVKSELGKANKKAEAVNAESFKGIFGEVKLLLELISSYRKKEYTHISRGLIVAALAAVMYFVSPVDAIFDFIPGLGYVDDVFVLSYVLKKLREELANFQIWKNNKLG